MPASPVKGEDRIGTGASGATRSAGQGSQPNPLASSFNPGRSFKGAARRSYLLAMSGALQPIRAGLASVEESHACAGGTKDCQSAELQTLTNR